MAPYWGEKRENRSRTKLHLKFPHLLNQVRKEKGKRKKERRIKVGGECPVVVAFGERGGKEERKKMNGERFPPPAPKGEGEGRD